MLQPFYSAVTILNVTRYMNTNFRRHLEDLKLIGIQLWVYKHCIILKQTSRDYATISLRNCGRNLLWNLSCRLRLQQQPWIRHAIKQLIYATYQVYFPMSTYQTNGSYLKLCGPVSFSVDFQQTLCLYGLWNTHLLYTPLHSYSWSVFPSQIQ